MPNSVRCGFLAGLVLLLAAAGTPAFSQANPPQEAKPEPAQEPSPASPAQPGEPSREGQIMAPTATPRVPGGEGFRFRAYEGHADFEVGYRWVSEIAGTTGVSDIAKDVYRSMVNLGDGPKLLRSNFSLRAPYGQGGLFDRMDVSANNWGGDPYNTVRLNLALADKYEFRADYRNLNYYNFLPQYANPLLLSGVFLGQHSLNVTHRSTDLELRLFPNNKIRPFVGYTRSSGFGPGFRTVEFTGNEFLVDTNWRYSSDDYRGGVEISLPKTTLVVEQGFRFLRNDTGLESGPNAGNNPGATFLGQRVGLDFLDIGYHDRTSLPYTKLMAKFVPYRSLRFSGRYIYSMADLDSTLGEVSSGSLVTLTERLVYRAGTENVEATAKRPNHNGAFMVEFSPISRLIITNELETRNTHTSGSALLASIFFGARSLAGPATAPARDVSLTNLAQGYLAFNRLHNQTEAEFDVGRGFSVRGGYRYSDADATVGNSKGDDVLAPESSSYSRNTGIAGVVYRRARWLRVGVDYEKNDTDGILTRTDLLDYDQVRFDWRVGGWKGFSTSGRIWLLRNTRTGRGIEFDSSHNRNYSFELNYDPSERFNFSVDYSKASVFSDILVLLPQTLQQDRSIFEEETHGLGGSVGVGVYRGARVDFGYRGILNSGNNALSFHQPFASLTIPLPNRLSFRTYWQYFGYNEKPPFERTLINHDPRGFQDFRAHLLTFSLAYAY
jgi:hypothetical protein